MHANGLLIPNNLCFVKILKLRFSDDGFQMMGFSKTKSMQKELIKKHF
jgi:hypothetical protein